MHGWTYFDRSHIKDHGSFGFLDYLDALDVLFPRCVETPGGTTKDKRNAGIRIAEETFYAM